MRLIIGGYAQGKLQYALGKYGSDCIVINSLDEPEAETASNEVLIINKLNCIIRDMLDGNETDASDIDSRILTYLNAVEELFEDVIIISDEVGNGVVPIDKTDRMYREIVGRVLIQLADRAESVDRIICGLPQKIK